MTEIGFGRESLGVHVGVTPCLESGHETEHITVARWDGAPATATAPTPAPQHAPAPPAADEKTSTNPTKIGVKQ